MALELIETLGSSLGRIADLSGLVMMVILLIYQLIDAHVRIASSHASCSGALLSLDYPVSMKDVGKSIKPIVLSKVSHWDKLPNMVTCPIGSGSSSSFI